MHLEGDVLQDRRSRRVLESHPVEFNLALAHLQLLGPRLVLQKCMPLDFNRTSSRCSGVEDAPAGLAKPINFVSMAGFMQHARC